MDIQEMMKQAQVMQERMQKMQEELAEKEVYGESGGGLVKVTMTCKGELRKLDISPDLLKPEEKETVEDLIMAAMNTARSNADETLASETQKMMAEFGLSGAGGLPGGF